MTPLTAAFLWGNLDLFMLVNRQAHGPLEAVTASNVLASMTLLVDHETFEAINAGGGIGHLSIEVVI